MDLLLRVALVAQVAAASQRSALLALYDATSASGWTNSSGWATASASHCAWYGVICDEDSDVVTLYLSGNELDGSLPDLGELSALETLALADNQGLRANMSAFSRAPSAGLELA